MAVSAVKKQPKGDDAGDAPPDAKAGKRGGSKMMLIAAVVVAIGAGVGGTYFFLQKGAGDKHEAKVEPPKPPVFITLDQFTVNLQLEESPQFLQVGLSLKVRDAHVADELKLYMPEVRDRTLLLLSSQKASTLLTLEGKRKLANNIVATINAILEPASAHAPPAPVQPPKAAKKPPKEEGAAEGEEDADEKAAAEALAKPPVPQPPPRRPPVQSVLFTSFIVQ